MHVMGAAGLKFFSKLEFERVQALGSGADPSGAGTAGNQKGKQVPKHLLR